MYDFAVVGLGTAGSYAAWRLAEQGYRVIGIDRRPYAGSTRRSTGGIGSYWMQESKIMNHVPEGVIAAELYGFKIVAPDGSVYHYRNNKKIGVVFHQHLFERMLARNAVKHGATLQWSCEAVDVVSGNTVQQLAVRNHGKSDSIFAYKVIIADGPNSPIGNKVGLAKPVKPIDMYHGGEFVFPNDGTYPRDEFVIHFQHRYAPKGYRWYFPEGDDAKIGNGVPLAYGRSKNFLENYVRDYNLQEQYNNPSYQMAGLIPIAKPYRRIVSNDGNFAIIGDAARHVIAITGGGIHLALVGGQKVAEYAGDLRQWQNYYHKSGLYKLLLSAYRAKVMFNEFSDDDFNRMVKSIRDIKLDDVMFDRPQRAMFKIIKQTFIKNPGMFVKCLRGFFKQV